MNPRVVIKKGRERPVRQRHPWVFSGAVQRVEGEPEAGDLVEVISSQGELMARGYFNPASQILVRLLAWAQGGQCESIDEEFWRACLTRAIATRTDLLANSNTSACRLVNAESDGLPGLVVDRYGDWLVLQSLTLGVERRKTSLVELLTRVYQSTNLPLLGIYERSDVDVRGKEGLEPASGVLWGREPPDLIEILENGHRFLVDVKAGHKTGFYLDQRDNRARVAPYCAGREVLNGFAYTGAFAVYALAEGASVVINVDTSAEALALAERNVALNRPSADLASCTYQVADVFGQLRAYRAAKRQFDLIILDPPKFVLSRSHTDRASRGYKDVNWVALQLIRAGGVLVTFSCSGLLPAELFQKILFGAALDAEREVQILERLSQASDHPVLLTFPESEYLKGFVCRVW